MILDGLAGGRKLHLYSTMIDGILASHLFHQSSFTQLIGLAPINIAVLLLRGDCG